MVKPGELYRINVLRSYTKSFDIVYHQGSTVIEYKVAMGS